MSRTFRKKIKSSKIIRDGERQYADSSCRHHGSCDYCKNNRTFEKAVSLQDEIVLAEDNSDWWIVEDNYSEKDGYTFSESYQQEYNDVIISRAQNKDGYYLIKGKTRDEIFEELTKLQEIIKRKNNI